MISWLITDADVKWPIVEKFAMLARVVFRSAVALEVSPIISKDTVATVLTRVFTI